MISLFDKLRELTQILNPVKTDRAEEVNLTSRQQEVLDIGLTKRQREVLHYVCLGYTNEEIMEVLDISLPTVKHHVSALLDIFQVNNRVRLVLEAQNLGLAK